MMRYLGSKKFVIEPSEVSIMLEWGRKWASEKPEPVELKEGDVERSKNIYHELDRSFGGNFMEIRTVNMKSFMNNLKKLKELPV